MIRGELCSSYCRMVVCKGIVNGHILEEPADMLVEEALDFLEAVLRVHEDSADIRLDYVRQSLKLMSALNRD